MGSPAPLAPSPPTTPWLHMCSQWQESYVIAHFMVYTRNVLVKKAKLQTCKNITKHLWNTFNDLENYTSIDITFDLNISYVLYEHLKIRELVTLKLASFPGVDLFRKLRGGEDRRGDFISQEGLVIVFT